MWKRIGCGIVAAAGALLMLPPAGANKNFVPDWTFKGSSLGVGAHARQRRLARGERRNRGHAEDGGGRLADSRQAAAGRAVRFHFSLHGRAAGRA